MKVFISSVTHLLKEERAALPPFLRSKGSPAATIR